MTPRSFRRRRHLPFAAALLAVSSLAMSSCVLSKIHSAAPAYRVVTGRCVFLGTTSSTNFVRCNYSRANFSGDNAPGIDFDATNWTGALMNDVQMQSSSFVGATFAHVTADNANFNAANFDHVDFAGANLSGSVFANATMHGDNFVGANLHGAKSMSAAALTGSLWRDTLCPDGTNSNHDGGTCLHDLSS